VALTDGEGVARLGRDRAAALLVDTLGGDGLIGRSRWVRQGGRAVVIGYVAGPHVELDLPSWLLDEVALLPVNMIRQERRAREVAGDLVRRLFSGELTVAVEKFGLDEVPQALDALRNGRVRGRAVVLPD
jgi:NADPH:quinone reductase-like Zn-dependent oxidoreductase